MALKSEPKILLFDLGGVIVPWVGIEALMGYSGLTREEVADRFAASEFGASFERGLASEADFIAEFESLYDLPDTDTIALWNSWVLPPYPRTPEALTNLKTRFTTACLSNTNSLHWAHLKTMYDMDAVFHYAFASHLLHEAKPDAASFLKVLELMNCAAEDVWFFDDTHANIDAARALGMTAFHVDRAVGVLPVLRDLNLID